MSAPAAGHLLGITPMNWFLSPPMNYGDMAIASIAAIKAGVCHTCICIHPLKVQWSMSMRPEFTPEQFRNGADFDTQFTAPFGCFRAVQWAGGMPMQRYMSKYGAKEEDFGRQQVAQRFHASMNDDDHPLFRSPMTLDDYMDSPYISKPMRILDCDMPCDTAGAVIFTTEERARDWKKKPVYIDAYAMADTGAVWEDFDHRAEHVVADKIWAMTDIRPKDVSCAQLYDGFSVTTFSWLEALGFCKPGEASSFVADGNTRLGGSLPINTDGGVANLGRRHGYSHVIEATRQLRGECGPRQVQGANVSIATIAGGFWAYAVLLTSE
jgi:acetyl-CoA acetyltransferase